jgi:hypothetical protein
MAKVIALGRNDNGPRNLRFAAGEVFEPTPELWAFLQGDAPDNFQLHHDAPIVDAPPADKVIKRNRTTRK